MKLDWGKDIDEETGQFRTHTYGGDLCYDIGIFLSKEKSRYKGIKQADVIFADLTFKSLGMILTDIFREILEQNKEKVCKLPELKKNRIIFFARISNNCIGYYIDIDPTLWDYIKFNDSRFQRGIVLGSFTANGKSHKIKFPPPNSE